MEDTEFTSQRGFGHEEWLFQERWTIEGRRYGFVRTGPRKEPITGEVDLTLFTRLPASNEALRVIVARVEGSFLTPKEAQKAWSEYTNRGWVEAMVDDIRNAGGDPSSLLDEDKPAHHKLNFTYRPKNLTYWPPTEREPKEDEEVLPNSHRYQLYDFPAEADREGCTDEGLPGRRTAADHKNTDPYKRRMLQETQVQRRHDAIQEKIDEYLSSRVEKVEMERNWVDLTVRAGGQTLLIEIKAMKDAWRGLREGLGQLFSYAAETPPRQWSIDRAGGYHGG